MILFKNTIELYMPFNVITLYIFRLLLKIVILLLVKLLYSKYNLSLI